MSGPAKNCHSASKRGSKSKIYLFLLFQPHNQVLLFLDVLSELGDLQRLVAETQIRVLARLKRDGLGQLSLPIPEGLL